MTDQESKKPTPDRESASLALSCSAEGGIEHMVPLPEDGPRPEIPEDKYWPQYNVSPVMESAGDSLAMGHMVWRKRLIGFLGESSGVMLAPEWQDALEP